MTPAQRAAYMDEADIFYADPKTWLQKNMQDLSTARPNSERAVDDQTHRRQWPEYLVIFEHLEATLLPLLKERDYAETKRFFNTHWHDDGRRKGDAIVLARNHT
jgi:phosphatidylinositol glycan class B